MRETITSLALILALWIQANSVSMWLNHLILTTPQVLSISIQIKVDLAADRNQQILIQEWSTEEQITMAIVSLGQFSPRSTSIPWILKFSPTKATPIITLRAWPFILLKGQFWMRSQAKVWIFLRINRLLLLHSINAPKLQANSIDLSF